jgi:predicted transcriptional regulator
VACIASDGTLSDRAKALLLALDRPRGLEEVAPALEQPLYRVRSSVRELVEAELVQETDGRFITTEKGRARLTAAS